MKQRSGASAECAMSSLSTEEYWSSYYKQSPHANFDWYLPNDVVLHHVHSVLRQLPWQSIPSPLTSSPPPTPSAPSSLRLLQLGCGSSSLTASLAPLYPHIANVDFSASLIHSLLHPASAPCPPLPPTVTYHCMDVRALSFADGAFDLVLDKGTFDCVWLGGGDGVQRMLDEAERVLRRGGAYMCFSLYGYDERMDLMEDGGSEEGGRGRRRRGWKVMYHVLEGPLEMPQQSHSYLYVAIKDA